MPLFSFLLQMIVMMNQWKLSTFAIPVPRENYPRKQNMNGFEARNITLSDKDWVPTLVLTLFRFEKTNAETTTRETRNF
jgi:hypothetical protein